MNDEQENQEELRPLIVIKRKKIIDGHGHSTAWKIALADFMTTLMIVFFVMWIVNLVPPEKKKIIGSFFRGNVSKKSEAGNSILPYQGAVKKSEKSETMKIYHSLEPDLNKLDPSLKVSLSRGRIEINLNSNVLFDIGKSNINSNFDAILNKVASVVKDKHVYVDIYGYTDNTPYVGGSNLLLSLERAKNTASALMENGLPSYKIGVHGEGERFPVASNDTEKGRSLNRRIILYVSPIPEKTDSNNNAIADQVNASEEKEQNNINADTKIAQKNALGQEIKSDNKVASSNDKDIQSLIKGSKTAI